MLLYHENRSFSKIIVVYRLNGNVMLTSESHYNLGLKMNHLAVNGPKLSCDLKNDQK